jgi:hypothetical protein
MRVSAVPGYRSRISEDADASSPPPTPPPPAARIATDEDFPSGSHEDASGAADARPGASVAKNDAAATRSRRRDGDDDVDGRRRGDDDARRRRRAGAAAGDADDATSEDDDEDAARRARRAADANCEDASARSACIGRRAEWGDDARVDATSLSFLSFGKILSFVRVVPSFVRSLVPSRSTDRSPVTSRSRV